MGTTPDENQLLPPPQPQKLPPSLKELPGTASQSDTTLSQPQGAPPIAPTAPPQQQQTVIYPISCVECRRRKVKCCRRFPCSQCVRRNIKCEYPEKFRSIEINNLLSNDEYVSNSAVASPLDTSGSNILSSTISVTIAKENEMLKRKIANLEKKLRQIDNTGIEQNECDNDTELSLEKYYGPNSSVFMIKLTQDAKMMEFNQFMKEKKILSKKRELPILIPSLMDGKNDRNLKMTNFSLICKLVSNFFQLRNYCNNFINEKEVFNFLHNYTDIKCWSNDDDLLLLIMILITTIRSLRRDDPLLVDHRIVYDSLNKKLMYQFEQLKHGIKNETLTSLKAYVLGCEHYYYHSQAEASWNLLFHTVSNAYSLGLHVYDKEIEISLKNTKKNTLKVIQNDPRTSLWLTINFISSVLCSVVGRPNPVTFTFQPLINSQDINLNYKIALSEITKYSTKILIDSYRVSISYAEITRIDEGFEKEIEIYEQLFLDIVEEQRELERQEIEKWKRRRKRQRTNHHHHQLDKSVKKETDLDVILNQDEDEVHSNSTSVSTEREHLSLLETPCETLCDLILFYSNRAKFHQPFMSTYQTSTKILLNSISKTFQHTIDLVKILTTKINNPNFQSIYPFFYCFLYQSFIVFYTFLYLNFEKILFFYKHEILEIHRYLQVLFQNLKGYWKKNAIRIIEQIFSLVTKFKEQYENFTRSGPNSIAALYPSLSNSNLSAMSDQPIIIYDSLGTDFNLDVPSTTVQPAFSIQSTSPAPHNSGNNHGTINNVSNIEHNMLQWDKDAMDNFQIDPILGFDLNDPFFMANPEGGIPNDYFGNVGNNNSRSQSNSTSL